MRRVPLPFVVAFAGGAVAAVAVAFARASVRRDPRELHSSAAELVEVTSQTLGIVIAGLLLAGTFALRPRQIGLLVVGAIALLAAAIARPICEHVVFERLPDYGAVLDARRWLGRVDTTGAVAFAAGLVFLGEHTERVRSLAVPLLGLAIVAHPALTIADDLAARFGDVPGTSSVWKAAIALGAIQLAFAACALAVLAAALAPRDERIVEA